MKDRREILSKNLKRISASKGILQKDITDKFGYPNPTVSDWYNGKKFPRIEALENISSFLGVPINELIEDNDEPIMDVIKLPLYSFISCGHTIFVDENIEEYITLPSSILNTKKSYFAQYAKGDSMINAGIHDGDLLIFEKVEILDNGSIGCFCVNHNYVTCKKFYRDSVSNIITLQSQNDNYEPIIIDVLNQDFRIVGKLSKVLHNYE